MITVTRIDEKPKTEAEIEAEKEAEKKRKEEIAFRVAYDRGHFSPFKYLSSATDWDFDSWVDDLKLSKPRKSLLHRKLRGIDFTVDFREDGSFELCVFDKDDETCGTIAVADLLVMVRDAIVEAEDLDTVRKVRDFLTKEIADEEERRSS